MKDRDLQQTSITENRSRKAAVLRVVLSVLGIALFFSLVFLILWLRGSFLPRWVTWETKTISFRISEPHELFLPAYAPAPEVIGEGMLVLENRQVSLYDHVDASKISVPIYRTPREWLVADALVSDINRDGVDEIILLVWKRGSFGGARPFWVTHDEIGFSEHVYIFKYMNGSLAPLWMSSKLDEYTLGRAIFIDENDRLHLTAPGGSETVWVWGHWGLKLYE